MKEGRWEELKEEGEEKMTRKGENRWKETGKGGVGRKGTGKAMGLRLSTFRDVWTFT